MENKISVIMSVYNGERYLREAIESVLKQTYSDFEFIIIDDCSTDSSAEIIKSYDDDRIVFHQNKNNIGLTKSLNFALKLAEGEFIARIDHDDISLPQRFEKQIEYFEKHPDTQILCTEVFCIDEEGDELINRKRIKTPEDIFYYLHFINPVFHPSVMLRKSVFENEGGYNEAFHFSQDYEMWYRLKLKYKIAKLNEPLIQYRKSESQISNSSLFSQAEFSLQLFDQSMKQIGLNSEEIKASHYFHTKAFRDDYKNINISKLKLLRKINNLIISRTPKFLIKALVKKTADKVFLYYISVYIRKIRIFNKAINFLKAKY